MVAGDPNILNMLNTKYVLVADKTGIQPKENPFANGPAWFVSEVKIADTPNEEIDLISKVDNKRWLLSEKKMRSILTEKLFRLILLQRLQLKHTSQTRSYTKPHLQRLS